MRGCQQTKVKCDGIAIIAGFLFLLYLVMSIAWCIHYDSSHLLWFCDIALLLTAGGLFFRSATLVTAQLVATLVFHLAWNFDFWLFLLFDYMPLDATAYMFYHDLSLFEKSLSFFSHVFVVPAALYGIYVLGAPKKAWLVQSVQTIVILILTYLLTRPEKNINLMFGAGILNVTPQNIHPVLYYALMAVVPPVIIYLPTNRLLTSVINLRNRKVSNWVEPSADSASVAGVRQSNRIALALVIIGIVFAAATSATVAHIADMKHVVNPAIFEVTSASQTRLEAEQTTLMSSVDIIQFGEGAGVRQVPQLVWPHATLPKQWSGLDKKLHAHTKSVLLEMSEDDLPSVPQEVLLRGTRSVPGSVVWAYVASNDFYLQIYPDLHGERDTFEVRCQIGGHGLSEYIDPTTGEMFTSSSYNEILGSGTGAIYALGTIEVNEGKVVAKSPYYLVKRRGIRFPEDIWFITKNGRMMPLLSNAIDPANSRVVFQSPLNSANGLPDVFSCDFFGYDLRNLSNNPDWFDGFISPSGQTLDAVGWLDGNILQYYTDKAGNLVPLRIADQRQFKMVCP